MQQRLWRRGPDGEVIRTEPRELDPVTEIASTRVEATVSDSARRRSHPWLALRLGFRDTYDYLGSVLLMSVLAALVMISGSMFGNALGARLAAPLGGRAGGLVAVSFALIGASLSGGLVAAGLFRFCRNACTRSEPEVFDLAWGIRGPTRRLLSLGLLQSAVTLVLGGNCYFYLFQHHPLFLAFGAVCGYLLAFWLLMTLYQWPLLIEQDLSPMSAVRKSALLVLDNLGYSLLIGLVVLLLTALLWGFVVPGVLLWGGTISMLLTQATRELLRKYGALPPDPTLDPIAGETHELGGHGRHE